MRVLGIIIAGIIIALSNVSSGHAGPIDPNCTPGKAVKGAAERATVGVGNRCKAGETARDTLGVDGKGKKKDGPLKKQKND